MRQLNFGSPTKGSSEDRAHEEAVQSKEVRELLKELNSGIHDKVTLLKMLILKCGEADGNYKKIKQSLNKGDVNVAEK